MGAVAVHGPECPGGRAGAAHQREGPGEGMRAVEVATPRG